MPRITDDMSAQEAIMELAEGNPGAMTVMIELIKRYDQRGHLALLCLDEAGYYGPSIWMGFKDVCGEDYDLFIDHVIKGSLPDSAKYQEV